MITGIVLENFKCFRKVEVNPRLITVFVGPNGSGKSSVLQALALLKQSVKRPELILEGSPLALSSPIDIVPKFQEASELIHIQFEGANIFPDASDFGIEPTVSFEYGAQFLDNLLVSRSGSLQFTSQGHQHEIKVSGPNIYDQVYELGQYQLRLGHVRTIATIAAINSWGKDEINPHFRSLIERILDTPSIVLKKIRFIPAARGFGRPRYLLGTALVDDVSISGGLGAQEEQAATNLAYSRPQIAKLSKLLESVTGVGLNAETVPPRSVAVLTVTPMGEVNIVAEGFGTNGLILLFLQLVGASKNATVMIEEPEIHLHPRAQAKLAEVLAEEAKADNKQLIMTTHSEHVLGRFLTLVAEKKLSSDELAIYAFEKDEHGICTANELEVTEDGRVKGGIKDFFETDLDELERYIRALQPEV